MCIATIHWGLPQNHFRMVYVSAKFTKICPRIILEWFTNHPRFTKICPRIISEWFVNERFTLESFQYGPWIRDSMRFTVNHIKTKVLPPQWSTAKWYTSLTIILFTLILIESHWFCKSQTFSHLLKTTGVDHIAVLEESNNFIRFKNGFVWQVVTFSRTIFSIASDFRIDFLVVTWQENFLLFSSVVFRAWRNKDLFQSVVW